MFSRGDRNARGFGDWEFCFFLSTDSCCGSGGNLNLFSVTNLSPSPNTTSVSPRYLTFSGSMGSCYWCGSMGR